jgi:hypothetical protein
MMSNTESTNFASQDRIAYGLIAVCLVSAAGAVVCGVLSLMRSF